MAAAPKKEKKSVDELSFDEITKLLRTVNKDTFALFGDKEITEFCTVERIPTNNPSLDYLLGGGITKGRVTCIAGEESAGKTTISLLFIAEVVRDLKARGSFKRVIWNDVEGAWDANRAKSLGIDQEYVIVWREKVIETFFDKVDKLISTGFIEAMVVDSLDNMIARKVEDNAYQATMGGTAGALGQHLPNLFSKIIEFNVTSIFIKQAREKVGGFNPTGRAQLIINGGRTFKHDCDSIIILEKRSNKDCDYQPIAAKAQKTRSPRLGKTYLFSLVAKGIDKIRDLVKLAIDHGLVTVGGGGWTVYGDIRVHGAEAFINHMRENPDDCKKLWDHVYSEVIASDTCIITEEAGIDEQIED